MTADGIRPARRRVGPPRPCRRHVLAIAPVAVPADAMRPIAMAVPPAAAVVKHADPWAYDDDAAVAGTGMAPAPVAMARAMDDRDTNTDTDINACSCRGRCAHSESASHRGGEGKFG